jgi:UDP-glucose 4-epimerase
VRQEFGVDIRDKKSLIRVLQKYSAQIKCVWNLAAPLSVETAKDPSLAHDITVAGMERLLSAMQEAHLKHKMVCFTDSIGSFGATAPRIDVPAKWLVENPMQDPGSDYGVQKRGCRELLRKFSKLIFFCYDINLKVCVNGIGHVEIIGEDHGFDTRWCVVPGVLHAEESWGAGTTE